MTASIWAPGSTNVPSVDPASQLLSQSFVATEGQTDFVITQFTYSINSGALTIYVNRAKLDHQYVTELNTTTFRIPACEVGDDVEVVGNVAINDPSLYADAAAASAAEALGYKNQTEVYKNEAAVSASNAQASEASAAANALAAANSESNALTYKNAAETAKNTAVSAKDTAVTASNTAVAAASDPNVVVVGQDLLEPVSEIETVASNIGNVNVVGANISNVNAVGANIANVNTVATNIASVNTVGSNITAVNTVATNITSVNTCATNIAAIIDAPNQANAAAASAADAQSSEEAAAAYAASINPADLVHKSGTETISGSKTFGAEVVLGYGTINRIPYLNNLKELITSDALTFDANGNLGIGTSSPSSVSGYRSLNIKSTSGAELQLGNTAGTAQATLWCDASGLTYNNHAATSHIWTASGVERMRIDPYGNWMIGTTTQLFPGGAPGLANILNPTDTGGFALALQNNATSNGNGRGLGIRLNTDFNTGSNEFLFCTGNTTPRFFVQSNGGIYNYQANNVNISDRREKTNITPAKDYLDIICSIPVQTFNYVDQNTEEDEGLTLGVVAQDVLAVAPEFVTEKNLGTAEDPKMRLTLYETDIKYALMKCIQELNAKLSTLEQQVADLKSTVTAQQNVNQNN